MTKKKVLCFTVADSNNFQYTIKMVNSLVKFHPPSKDVDILVITDVEAKEAASKLPKGIILEDLKPYLKDDPYFFYRQKPIVMERYLDEYELVIGLDSDQIILGDISYIWNTKDYDVATVLNFNRIDPQTYGYVELNQIGINPMEYFNCGLVACRSKQFAHHWSVICFNPQFDRIAMREQGILNVLCYYGNYNIRCLDHQDELGGNTGWWGLIAKSELQFAKMRENGDIYIPKGQGDTPYPPRDTDIKIVHFAGGNTPNKTNYRLYIPDEEIIKRIDYLVSAEK